MRILHWVTIWILHPKCVVPTRSHGVVHGECRRSWPHSIMDAGILKVAASVSMGTWQWCEVLEGGNFGVKTRLTLHHTTCQDLDAYVVQCIHGDQIDWDVDLVIGLCVVVPGWWQLRAGGVWCVGWTGASLLLLPGIARLPKPNHHTSLLIYTFTINFITIPTQPLLFRQLRPEPVTEWAVQF